MANIKRFKEEFILVFLAVVLGYFGITEHTIPYSLLSAFSIAVALDSAVTKMPEK